MARRSRELSYGAIEIDNNETLGIGSYGKVCKAKCGQLPCAVKLLHGTMFEDNDPGISRFIGRFKQECEFLRMIKHPNIVQFLGISRDPQSGRPGLLMELMDESLSKFLEQSTGPLPYHIQFNMCQDVALALAYLHSNGIIHRDLSSNNVLLIGQGTRAKVTDFGMSTLMDRNSRMTPLTQCPGTVAYMPPEALIMPPQYSSKLDCFSHGVLTIQVATRQFPNPGDAHRYVENPAYPTGQILVSFPETERRKEHIDQVEPDHPLLPLALHCLKDRDTERPSADELCGRLASLKREPKYQDSVEQCRDQITSLQQQLQDKVGELARARENHEVELNECHTKLQEKDEDMARIRANNVIELESIVVNYKEKLNLKIAEIEQLRKEMGELPQTQYQPKTSSDGTMRLAWRRGRKAPYACTLASYHGAAVVHNNTAYFSIYNEVYLYTILDNMWYQLPCCSNYEFFSMAILNDKLTTIGGSDDYYRTTNILLSFSEISTWEKLLPPMPTEREMPAAVTTPTHLVVAGGVSEWCALSVVEVLDCQTHHWASATCSPKSLALPNMTLCDGHLYLSQDSTIFCCSVVELLQSSESPSFPESSCDSVSVWKRLSDIPVHSETSTATVSGRVLAIGGKDHDSPTADIHCYDRSTDSWSVISRMSIQRHDTLVAVLHDNELVVVGGLEEMKFCEETEIARS